MLPASHNRAYQDFLTLLTEFKNYLISIESKEAWSSVNQQFEQVSVRFEEKIMKLSSQDLEAELAGRWQSVQTEIKREFQLLSADMIFLAAARQPETTSKRISQVEAHLSKLIGYCQIMLADSK